MQTFAIAMGVLLAAGQVSADLILYDGFDYTAGQILASWPDPNGVNPSGQCDVQYNQYWRYAGLTNPTGNNPPNIHSGSLAVPGMPAPVGNSLGFDETQIGSARIAVPTGPITSGTTYWSGFLRVNTIGTLTSAATGLLAGGFNNLSGPQATAPTVFGALLKIRKNASDSTQYFVGTGVNNTTGNLVYATSAPQVEGSTVFVVASYTYNPGTTDDVVKMWINPSSADFGAALPPTATISGALPAGGNELPAIASFDLRTANTVGAPDFQFDELRIGNTWADVTTAPEPATLGLLAVAVGGHGVFSGLRRRKAAWLRDRNK
jgi:hypothetical protein